MEDFDIFIDVLENSVKKNGKDYPLTLGHLLNLVRLADKIAEEPDYDEGDLHF